MLGALKRLAYLLVAPLLEDDEMDDIRLSMPETATTTYNGSEGWSRRPPAVLRCPECGERAYQHRARDEIQCSDCFRSYSEEEFSELELLELVCPKCETSMRFGRRHPRYFDVPQWATCDSCHYHWEYSHTYKPIGQGR